MIAGRWPGGRLSLDSFQWGQDRVADGIPAGELEVLGLRISGLGTHHMSNSYMTKPIHVM